MGVPQVVVLDTHVWFWWVNLEFDRFPVAWRAEIERAPRVGVCPVSCYELALAHRRGRLELPVEPAHWFREALQPAGVEVLPITPAIATRAVELPDLHRDPFDRLIIATALEYGAALASVDGLFRRYPELSGRLLPS